MICNTNQVDTVLSRVPIMSTLLHQHRSLSCPTQFLSAAATQAANVLVHTDGRVVLSDFGVTATLERHADAEGRPPLSVHTTQ